MALLRLPQALGAQEPAPLDSAEQEGLPLRPARQARIETSEGTWMSVDVSPNGATVVFDLLGDLYAVPVTGGNARRLTFGMAVNRQPRYSPDGRHLVFVSDHGGSDNVWIADGLGRHARQISKLEGYAWGAVMSPAWSPDGRSIVVSQLLGATRSGSVGLDRYLTWLGSARERQPKGNHQNGNHHRS